MQTRPTDYLNTKTFKPSYGIKVKHNGKWINAGDDDGLFLFDTPEERDAKRRELAKHKIPMSAT